MPSTLETCKSRKNTNEKDNDHNSSPNVARVDMKILQVLVVNFKGKRNKNQH